MFLTIDILNFMIALSTRIRCVLAEALIILMWEQ